MSHDRTAYPPAAPFNERWLAMAQKHRVDPGSLFMVSYDEAVRRTERAGYTCRVLFADGFRFGHNFTADMTRVSLYIIRGRVVGAEVG